MDKNVIKLMVVYDLSMNRAMLCMLMQQGMHYHSCLDEIKLLPLRLHRKKREMMNSVKVNA